MGDAKLLILTSPIYQNRLTIRTSHLVLLSLAGRLPKFNLWPNTQSVWYKWIVGTGQLCTLHYILPDFQTSSATGTAPSIQQDTEITCKGCNWVLSSTWISPSPGHFELLSGDPPAPDCFHFHPTIPWKCKGFLWGGSPEIGAPSSKGPLKNRSCKVWWFWRNAANGPNTNTRTDIPTHRLDRPRDRFSEKTSYQGSNWALCPTCAAQSYLLWSFLCSHLWQHVGTSGSTSCLEI